MRMLLQLFATNTTESKLAGNDLSAEMKTYYEKRLIDLAEPKLVHDQFGDKYPIPAGNGRTIEFRKYDSLAKATTPIVEGVTPTGNDLNVSSVQETVMQYGDWIQMSDLLEMSAVDNNVLQATRLLGAQAGRTLDSITRDVLAGGTNVIYAPSHANGTTAAVTSRSAIDESCKLDGDLIFRAAAQLKGMNAEPIDEAYVAIIHPYVAYDLMRSQEWIDAHKYASPEEIYNGEIGELHGVRFIENFMAPVLGGTSYKNKAEGVTYATYFFGKDAFGIIDPAGGGAEMIIKDKGTVGGPLEQFSTVGYKFETNGATILYPERVLRVMSVSSYSATDSAN